jgi:hypothetical protein
LDRAQSKRQEEFKDRRQELVAEWRRELNRMPDDDLVAFFNYRPTDLLQRGGLSS